MPDLLEEAKRLSEAVTTGPWTEWGGMAKTRSAEDQRFIARARTLIPELVGRVEQAGRRAEKAERLHRRASEVAIHERDELAKAWERIDELEEALAAQQREVEGG